MRHPSTAKILADNPILESPNLDLYNSTPQFCGVLTFMLVYKSLFQIKLI